MLKTPIKRYVNYFVENAGENQYRVRLIYFMDKGNTINDINIKREKVILCEESELKSLKFLMAKRINKTQERLERAFYDIGATPQNVFVLMNEKMR